MTMTAFKKTALATDTLDYTMEHIGPVKANEYLDTIVKNRRVKPYHVTALAEQMTLGLWNVTGETIKFDRHGHMIDGEHRMLAVVKSGVTIQTIVVRGLEQKSQLYVDTTAARRSAGDVFQFAEVPNAQLAAAVMRWVVAYEHGEWGRFSFQKRGPVVLLDRYREDADVIQECIRLTGHQRLSPPGMLGALYFVLAQSDLERARSFMQLLVKGTDLSADHPIYVVRERLILNAQAGAGKRKIRKAPPMEQCAWIVRTWNAMLTGRSVRVMKWTLGLDKFPEILTSDMARCLSGR